MKLLIIQIAGLGFDFASAQGLSEIAGCKAQKLQPVFPALTCTVQATLRTAQPPSKHGVAANGFMETRLRKALFWEQSSALIDGERIWNKFRENGGSVGMAFFQQSLGESVDQIISPAPLHKHNGGMIMDCSSKPESLYAALQQFAGGPFKLHRYWGPLASSASSQWIAKAITGLINSADTPDLLFTYLPCLDYDLQRHGTDHPKSAKAAKELRRELTLLFNSAKDNGYDVIAFGDYAITDVSGGAIFPNRTLKKAGLLKTRRVKSMLYPDMHQSKAFAVVDHQVAMVTCFDQSVTANAAELLSSIEGVDSVMDAEEQSRHQANHPNSGDLLITAKPGYWFAYPWWNHNAEAPDYAAHVDIHNKPGYDPCELFSGTNPFHTSQDTEKIKGTHGLTGPGYETALFTTLNLNPETLLELSQQLKERLS
ncbi:MAG: alkaline phosphatase family protein [Kiritimatiellae bacterium]|jgi:predicted AlkP superfamily pyrophosphatase or phosphodiesterase|nr:alkaline phosphatase family protein [Kiritimatiellia bacterium]